jgi:alkylation response protein AidB-like acyl-CoA dehydrogenase
VGEGVLNLLVQYVRESRLSRDPLVRQRLAQMAIEIEASRLLLYRLASLVDKGATVLIEASESKYFLTEAMKRCAESALELTGIFGCLTKDSKWTLFQGLLNRWFSTTLAITIFAGTSEIQKLIISRSLRFPK